MVQVGIFGDLASMGDGSHRQEGDPALVALVTRYLRELVNLVQALAGRLSVTPSRSVVSRTAT